MKYSQRRFQTLPLLDWQFLQPLLAQNIDLAFLAVCINDMQNCFILPIHVLVSDDEPASVMTIRDGALSNPRYSMSNPANSRVFDDVCKLFA